MSIIQAGENCISCGLCASVCPVMIVEMTSENIPFISETNSNGCLECGQCVAVCPKNTLHHDAVEVFEAPILPEDASGLNAIIKNRRSVRKFAKKEIDEELLVKVFDTLRYAPTGANLQPVKWTVITSEEKINELVAATIHWMKERIEEESPLLKKIPMAYFVDQYEKGNQRLTYHAPCIVIARTDKDYWHGGLDATIAMSYFEIIANAHGLGTCWVGAMDLALKHSELLRSIIGMDNNEINHNVLLLGEGALKYPQIPSRKKINATIL